MNLKDTINHLDINPGDIVYICSDITGLLLNSRKNKDNFDPKKFIDSIINKVGSKGTILFPTFNWGFCKNKRFDIQKTPSQCGALTNEALKRKDFERTQHPIYSFSVWGKDKEKLTKMDKKKGKPSLGNLLCYTETLKFANNLKNKISEKIKNYGNKSQDLLQSVEFILDENLK